ncbi:MAG TPA: RDD family protein [Jiangellaceae bacterium]|nr:RDD family protein [Jiangellaceae bacterium]
MHELALRRGKAYVRDCVGYLGVAAATTPIGLLAVTQGWSDRRGFVLAISALPPALATAVAAWRESRSGQASTPGKRWQGLVVRTSDGAPRLPRALLRNAVKIGIPWQLGHVVAVGAVYGGFEQRDLLTYVAATVVYPLIAAMVLAVLLGRGLALHDRVTGTWVDTQPLLVRAR